MIDSDIAESIESGAEKALGKQTENLLQTLGGWASSLVMQSDYLMNWRVNNLISTSKKFDNKCAELGLSREHREAVSSKFGIVWLQGVADEDNVDIQDLWADVLVSEARKNSSISVRTLNLIKSMTGDEKLAFDMVCSLASKPNKIILPCQGLSALEKNWFNFDYSLFLKLRDIGLLSSDAKLGSAEKTIKCLNISGRHYDFKCDEDRIARRGVKTIVLSTSGAEIFNALNIKPNQAYSQQVLKSYRDNGWKVNESLCKHNSENIGS